MFNVVNVFAGIIQVRCMQVRTVYHVPSRLTRITCVQVNAWISNKNEFYEWKMAFESEKNRPKPAIYIYNCFLGLYTRRTLLCSSISTYIGCKIVNILKENRIYRYNYNGTQMQYTYSNKRLEFSLLTENHY